MKFKALVDIIPGQQLSSVGGPARMSIAMLDQERDQVGGCLAGVDLRLDLGVGRGAAFAGGA